MYKFEQNNKKPLYVQLYEQIKKDIIENYKLDEKLPSIRKIMTTYNISKNTVEAAYSQLVIEGYIESFPKKGYLVINNEFQNFENSNIQIEKTRNKEDILYDFFPARLHKSTFPLKLWKRVYSKAINESVDLGMYSDKQGEYKLRVEIAKYLNHSRAVNCSAEQIIMTNGFADSLSIIAMLFNSEIKNFSMEKPGYHVARKVFLNHNYNIDDISINDEGIDIKKLKQNISSLLYITPSHQYPTGVTIPISNRNSLLSWAKETSSYIIEDDYDTELSYFNKPIPSLQGLDTNDRVIYFGTFSKALSPALRVGYLVLPKHLIEKYKQKFMYHACRVCLITQKTLELFIKEGFWDKHLRRIRTINKKKHNLMKTHLLEKLGSTIKIEMQGGGLAILINPTVNLDWEKLEKLAQKKKIKLHYTKERTNNDWQALMMGFGGFKEEEIEKAVTAFSKIWFESIS